MGNTPISPLDDGEARARRQVVASIEAAWNAAGSSWNAEALTAIYTADALFFGGRPGLYVGAEAIRQYFASYDGVILSGAMALVEQHIVELAPGVLLAQGFADFSFMLSGDEATKSRLRSSMVLVLQDGAWKIRQYHFSPPPPVPPLGRE